VHSHAESPIRLNNGKVMRAARESPAEAADNAPLGAHMLVNMALYLLFVSLFFYFDGILFGVAIGWWLAFLVTVIVGYMFRWYVEFNIWVAVCLAPMPLSHNLSQLQQHRVLFYCCL